MEHDILEKKALLIEMVDKGKQFMEEDEVKNILEVLDKYNKTFSILDNYDHEVIHRPKGNKSEIKVSDKKMEYLVGILCLKEDNNLFGRERIKKGLNSIINDLYATYEGEDIYSSIEEKAANLLYFVVKNHIYIDGNKRIAATLFIYFLYFYNILYVDNHLVIDNNTLASVTLLIALSKPKDKEIMVDLVMSFLT